MAKPYFNADLFIALRRRHGYTQRQLADKLGMTHITISKWENGRQIPETENVAKVAELLKVDPAIFMSKIQRLAWQNYIYWVSREASKGLTADELAIKESVRKDVITLNAVPSHFVEPEKATKAEKVDADLL